MPSRRASSATRRTDADATASDSIEVVTLIWLALLVSIAAAIGSAVFAVRRGLSSYRAVRATLGRLTDAVEDAVRRLDETPKHLDEASAATERLTNALAHLARSRARLALL